MNSEIIAYRDKKIEIMKEDPLELNHYITSDKARAEDYAGREVLELLQNAVDVGENVRVSLSDDILVVSNSGRPFGTDNIKALMIPDNSTKTKSDETIGCKGVGFRAALNISDDISIHSGSIHIRFSRTTAEKIKDQYELEQTPPIMRCPEEITDCYSNEYTTNIVIKIRDNEQVKRIQNQIESLKKESILFLKDTFRSLKTDVNGLKHVYSRKRDILGNYEALITISCDGESTTLREFYEEGELDCDSSYDNRYKISVVYSPDPIKSNKLYSFFHTDINFPMHHWFAHGTFNLTNNRNQLVKNSRNHILMKKMIKLICSSAPRLSSKIDYTGYVALKKHGQFSDTILEDTDLNGFLIESINDTFVMPTVHNRYISINDGPIFYDINLQKFLAEMPKNDDLLQFTNNDEIVQFLKEDTYRGYELETVSKYLREYKFSSNECRIECAKLLHQHYGNQKYFADNAPNFFFDNNGDAIENNSILIESDMSKNLVIPPFIKLKYIDNELLELAKRCLNSLDNNDFISTDFAKSYGFKIADIDEILEKIYDFIEEHPESISTYVRWLFDNRNVLSGAYFKKYFLLTKDNEVRRSNNLYFGTEYIKNTPLEKFYDPSKIVAKPAMFNIKTEEIDDFKYFLKEILEVADYPRNKEGSIDGLEKILKTGSTKYIVNLILQNRNFLNASRYSSCAIDDFRGGKWIEKNKKRYAPNDVVLTSKHNYLKISNYLEGDFLFISQDDFLSNIQIEKSVKVWLIEEYLCFKKEFYELDDKCIYRILNELPDFDLRGEISEDIYKDVIVNNGDREKPSLELFEFDNFINNGKVFCLDRDYHNIKECLYLKKKYPKVIESDFNFINITKGRSANAIWDRFRINTLEVDYTLHGFKKSQYNTIDFKNDINNLKLSILAENLDRFEKEDDLKELKDINIILCDSIEIEYDGKIGKLEEYEFCKKGDDFYIKTPQKMFSVIKSNDKFQDSLSDIFRLHYGFLDKEGTARTIGRDINSRMERVRNEFGGNAWLEAEERLNLISHRKTDYSSENAEILNNLRDKYFNEYKRRLYSKLQNSSLEEKSTYIGELNRYREYVFDINSIPSSKDSNMLEYLFGVYPILNENIIVIENVDLYRNDAYRYLCNEFSDHIDLLEQVLDDNRFESLLRFKELAIIRSEMNDLISKIKENEATQQTGYGVRFGSDIEAVDIRNTNDFNNTLSASKEDKDDIKDLEKSNKNENKYSNKIKTIHFDYKKIANTLSQQAHFVAFDELGSKSEKAIKSSDEASIRRMSIVARKSREDRAKRAEKLALEELRKQGYKNILWVSAYAKEEGINPDGADGYGYDIQCEKNNEVRYIEVKSSVSSIGVEFEMSENELKFCSQHANNYDIFYVLGMNTQSIVMTIIDKVFYRINNYNKTPMSYKIRLK